MLPDRFLRPWEIYEVDIQDMKVISSSTSSYLLVAVDRAIKLLLAFPLPKKQALGVSRQLLELFLLMVPLSIRCDPGSEFIAAVTRHLCRWLRVPLDFGQGYHRHAQRVLERRGGWLHGGCSWSCASHVGQLRAGGDGIHRLVPDEGLSGHATP